MVLATLRRMSNISRPEANFENMAKIKTNIPPRRATKSVHAAAETSDSSSTAQSLPPSFEAWKRVFLDFTPNSVHDNIDAAYSKDAFLNDRLDSMSGRGKIEKYLASSASKVSSCRFDIASVVRNGNEILVRWTMNIESKWLHNGQCLADGVSVLKLDHDDLISEHIDYWDPVGGLLLKVAGVGLVTDWVRRIRGK